MRGSHESHELARIFTNQNGDQTCAKRPRSQKRQEKDSGFDSWRSWLLGLLARLFVVPYCPIGILEDSCQFVRFVAPPPRSNRIRIASEARDSRASYTLGR